MEWFDSAGILPNLLPADEAWAALLREVSGRDQISCPVDPLLEHDELSTLTTIRERLASRNSALFPSERAVVEHDSEVEGQFSGHHLRTNGAALIVDGVRVDRGPGLLLFRMMTERRGEPPAHRFLKILRLIEGDTAAEAQQLHKSRRAMLRDGRFQTTGAADATRYDAQNGHTHPPPLCDWDCERYLLGIEVGAGGRNVIPFCGDCCRARLSSSGELYTCLFAETGFDLKGPLRSGASDGELQELVRSVWSGRRDRYSEERGEDDAADRIVLPVEMSHIGG